MKLRYALLFSLVAIAGFAAFPGMRQRSPSRVAPPQKSKVPGNPNEAYRWRRLAWLSADGTIPKNAFATAMGQRQANILASGGSAQDASVNPWVFRGPTNVAGRTRGLVVKSDYMLAGSVGGGLWRSTNGGSSWTTVSDWLPSLNIGCVYADPNDSNTVYAGTGEGFFNGDALGGVGILKSKDKGLTWSLLPGTSDFGNTCRIAVAPGNSNLMLASIRYGGIRRSTDGGITWSTPYWAQGSYQVIFHPTDANKAIAHVIDYDFGAGQWFHRALYSNNGGQSWTPAGGLDRRNDFGSRIELCYNGNGTKVYASVAGASGGNIFRSLDGGQNFTQIPSGTDTGVNWYANPLWVDPTNDNNLVTGGYVLYRSTNGGATMNQISDGYILTVDPHPDMHGLVADPGFNGTTNRRLFVTNDGGVYRSDDILAANPGATWVRRDVSYNSTQFYAASGHGPSNIISGGLQDNGTLTIFNGTTSAYLTYGGDGGWTQIDPTNSNYIYGEYINLTIHRSTNGGISSSNIYSGLGDAGSNANFIAPFILDLNNPNRMLAGGRSLWRSNNVKAGTPTWSAIRPAGTDNISAIAIAPGNSDVVWVGQNDGMISKSVNGTATTPTWTAVDNNSGPNPLPNRYVTRIAIDPTNSNIVYASFGGFDGDSLYRTANGGTTWLDVTGAGVTGLPNVPIRGIAIHPANSQRLYVGTEVGVFTSPDGGLTWTTSNFGPANVSTDDVNFMHGSSTLLAATHGRGLWTLAQPNPAGKLSGIVTLGNWNVSSGGQTADFEFRAAGTNTVISSRTVTLSANGGYTILDPGVPTGNYDIYVKSSHWLKRKVASKVLTANNTDTASVSLLNGDCDGDNVVSVFDYIILSDAFDTATGGAGFDARADLDGDGVVSVFDYIVLSDNFDKAGD